MDVHGADGMGTAALEMSGVSVRGQEGFISILMQVVAGSKDLSGGEGFEDVLDLAAVPLAAGGAGGDCVTATIFTTTQFHGFAGAFGGDTVGVQVFRDAVIAPASLAEGVHLAEPFMFLGVGQEFLAEHAAMEALLGFALKAGQGMASVTLDTIILVTVFHIEAVGELAAEFAGGAFAGHLALDAAANAIAFQLGEAGLEFHLEFVVGSAREGAALGDEMGGDAGIPDVADGLDDVEGVAADTILFGGDQNR